jgi:hypothetical protein
MKRLVIFLCILFFGTSAFSQKDSTSKNPGERIRQFWLVILKTGPKDKEITDSLERKNIFAGHFANMSRLHEEGILKAAGPF